MNTFTINNKNIQFLHNNIKLADRERRIIDLTERRVEIPLAKLFLDAYGTNSNCIEIGCVTPYYFDTKHKIYDLTDRHQRCVRKNALDIDIKNTYLLSISTIEHFDMGDYNIHSSEFLDPYTWLKSVITHAQKYLITFPLGFNKNLDNQILQSDINTYFLCRNKNSHIWHQKDKTELTEFNLSYDFAFRTCGNSIAIFSNIL